MNNILTSNISEESLCIKCPYSECSLSARARVIGWISQGIGKVVPQPDEKYIEKETPESEEVTEVQDFSFYFSIYFRSMMYTVKTFFKYNKLGYLSHFKLYYIKISLKISFIL